jgi:hypothetical protein
MLRLKSVGSKMALRSIQLYFKIGIITNNIQLGCQVVSQAGITRILLTFIAYVSYPMSKNI